ncbi:MAG: hypothetical protein JNN05_07980 [Candidatus Omnitrophica bacterium]|nr:hypothetical protein [Candidatus Omnitrophota bacterium]
MNRLVSVPRTGLIILTFLLAGCAGLNLPGYIQSEHPYKRVYYGDFKVVLGEVKTALNQEGWQVVKEVDPLLYERNPLLSEGSQDHVLIFTNVRKFQRVVYSQVQQLNVYVNRVDEGVEVDVRYRSVKNFYVVRTSAYRSDKLVKRLLDRIEQRLLSRK